jgi:cell division protein FtsX
MSMNRAFNKLLLVLLVLVLCVVGFGFYRGWIAVSGSSPDTESNKVNINLTMDPDKVKADAETVKEAAAELTGPAKEKSSEPDNQANDNK